MMWRDAILQRATTNVQCYNHQLQSSIPLGTHVALRNLQSNFVVCPVDKTSHNLAICCKQWYLHRLSTELDSPSYSSVGESPQTILRRHEQWNKDRGYTHKNVLPYLYYVLKAHKSPATGRGIAGTTLRNHIDMEETPPTTTSSSRTTTTTTDLPQPQPATPCEDDTTEPDGVVSKIHSTPLQKPQNSTTAASRALSYALQGVIQTLRDKDDTFFNATGARRFWIVQSVEEVINEIKAEPSIFQNLTPRTADFTSMYTKLPQDRILHNVEKAIREAHAYQRSKTPCEQLFMHTSTDMRGQWTTMQQDDTLSVDDMIAHLQFIVKNTYFMASDGTLRHQLFGIPMGTNAGPEIANLCLYVDEAAYVDKLIADGNLREAQKHAYTRRFIDDVLSWSTLPPSSEQYGLEWKETTNIDGSCTFLGVKIQKWLNGMIRLSVFDKAAEWNFHVIRYPSKYSNIPIHQPAGIFTGQVTRFWQICNNILDFKHATTQLTLRLLLRGHCTSTLMKGWNKYVQRHHRRSTCLTTKITHWFKKMVKWALHHPLADPSKYAQPTSSQPTQPTTTPTNAEPDTSEPTAHAPSGSNASNACADPRTAARNTTQQPTTSQRKRKRTRGTLEPAANNTAHKRVRLDVNMCGLHALNACLHTYALPVHTADTLSKVAADIDKLEEDQLRNEARLSPRSLRVFLRNNGTNRNLNGFTLQTLLRAFTHSHLPYSEPRNLPIAELPATCRAILLHQHEPRPLGHFVAVCKRNNSWQLWDGTSCTQTFGSLADMLFFVSAFTTVILCTP
jgi:hypothetical protein